MSPNATKMLYIGYRTRSRGQEFVVHDSHTFTCPQLRLTLDLVCTYMKHFGHVLAHYR